MNIGSLIKTLSDLRYTSRDGSSTWPVISSSYMDLVENEIKLWATKQEEELEINRLIKTIGHLEAKCTAYEAIIKNSNFAPAIEAVTKEPEE